MALGPWRCSLCMSTCAFGLSRGWGTQTWLRIGGGDELAQATTVRGWGMGEARRQEPLRMMAPSISVPALVSGLLPANN